MLHVVLLSRSLDTRSNCGTIPTPYPTAWRVYGIARVPMKIIPVPQKFYGHYRPAVDSLHRGLLLLSIPPNDLRSDFNFLNSSQSLGFNCSRGRSSNLPKDFINFIKLVQCSTPLTPTDFVSYRAWWAYVFGAMCFLILP